MIFALKLGKAGLPNCPHNISVGLDIAPSSFNLVGILKSNPCKSLAWPSIFQIVSKKENFFGESKYIIQRIYF